MHSRQNPQAGSGQQQLPSLSEFDIMTNPYQAPIRSFASTRESIGRPVTFTNGLFTGRTIRAELIELQKADLGRKYARKDRRPLDPPPVVQLRLFDVSHYGTAFESHKEFDTYDERGFGLLCHIDLFPVPLQEDNTAAGASHHAGGAPSTHLSTPGAPPPSASSTATAPSGPYPYGHPATASPYSYPTVGSGSSRRPAYGLPSQHGGGGGYSLPPPAPPSHGSVTLPPISSLDGGSSGLFQSMHLPPMQGPSDFSRSGLTLPPLTRQQPALSPYSYPPPAPPGHVPHVQHQEAPQAIVSTEGKAVRAPSGSPDGVIAYLNGHAIKEDDKCTESLVGARFCQASSLEWQGRKVLMFVFSDIAVQIEGSFILRYRVFNLFSQVEGAVDIPILAECYGGPFRIYSTKEFPGLRPSTDLTKHLSLFGVRLNLRETERKRRRTGRSSDATSPDPAARGRRGGRRGRGREDAEDSDDSSDED